MRWNKGFSLIELLVVIGIIGLLSTLAIVKINSVRKMARDTRRMNNLRQIQTALILYNDDHGNWIEDGSGCGSGGDGNGWFNYKGGAYPESTVSCLVDSGILSREIIDPSGDRVATQLEGNAYMKYHCDSPTQVYIFANLEGRPQDPNYTDATCCLACDSNYGINYFVRVN